jgi:hypothetical protein
MRLEGQAAWIHLHLQVPRTAQAETAQAEFAERMVV